MKIHSQRRKSILENKLLTRIPNSSSSLLRTCFHSSPELFLAVSGQNSPQCKLVQPAFHYFLVHLLTLILEQIKVFIGATSQWPLTVVIVLLRLPFYQNVHHWKKNPNVNSDWSLVSVNTVGYSAIWYFHMLQMWFWCSWSVPLCPWHKKAWGGSRHPRLPSSFTFLLHVTFWSPVKNWLANCLVAAKQVQEEKAEI